MSVLGHTGICIGDPAVKINGLRYYRHVLMHGGRPAGVKQLGLSDFTLYSNSDSLSSFDSTFCCRHAASAELVCSLQTVSVSADWRLLPLGTTVLWGRTEKACTLFCSCRPIDLNVLLSWSSPSSLFAPVVFRPFDLSTRHGVLRVH